MPSTVQFSIPEEVPESFTPSRPLFQPDTFAPPPIETAEASPTDNFLPPPPETAELEGEGPGFWEQRINSLARGIGRAEQFANILGATQAAVSASATEEDIRMLDETGTTSRIDFPKLLERQVEIQRQINPDMTEEEVADFRRQRTEMFRNQLSEIAENRRTAQGRRTARAGHMQGVIGMIPETEAMQAFNEAQGLGGTLKALATNPAAIADLALESLPASAPGMVAGATAGTAVGPGGTAAGAFIGATLPEMAGRMMETMQEVGVNLEDPEQIEAFLNDPVKRAEAIKLGARKGMTIGAIGALFAGLGGRFLSQAVQKGGVPRIAGAAATEGAIQTAGEGVGEIVGQAASGQDLSIKDIIAEMAGGFGANTQEVLTNTLRGARQAQEQLTQPIKEAAREGVERLSTAAPMGEAVQNAQSQLRTQGANIGTDAIEDVTESNVHDPDQIADLQKQITEETDAALAAQKDLNESAQEIAEEIRGSAELITEAQELSQTPEVLAADEAVQSAQDTKVYFDTVAEVEKTNPELAAMMKYPEAANVFEAQRDRLPGNTFIEIENEDGTREPAVFSGYWMEDTPAIGSWEPELSAFSHGMLGTGQRIVTPVPSFAQWQATQQPQETTDAVQIEETTGVSQDQRAEDLQPLEEEIREEGEAGRQAQPVGNPLPPNTRFTIQKPEEDFPGYVQVDLVDQSLAEDERNTRSSNPRQLEREGYAIPVIPADLPSGQYTIEELAQIAQERADAGQEVQPLTFSESGALAPIAAQGAPAEPSAEVRGREAERAVAKDRSAAKTRRLAKIGIPADGNPDLINAIQDAGGVPAPSRQSGGEYDGFRDAFQGVARFLVNTNGRGTRYGPGGIDAWLEGFADETGYRFETIDDFYSAVWAAQDRRKELLRQEVAQRKIAKVEEPLLTGRKKRKRDQSDFTFSSSALVVGDEFRVDGERFVVIAIDPDNDDAIIQDGITYRLADGTEFYPDKGSLVPLGRMNQRIQDEEDLALLEQERLAEEALREGLESAATTEEMAFEPPPLDTAEAPVAEPQALEEATVPTDQAEQLGETEALAQEPAIPVDQLTAEQVAEAYERPDFGGYDREALQRVAMDRPVDPNVSRPTGIRAITNLIRLRQRASREAAYEAIGSLEGVEAIRLRHRTVPDIEYIISRNTIPEGKPWRVTRIDNIGPSGHTEHGSLEEAIDTYVGVDRPEDPPGSRESAFVLEVEDVRRRGDRAAVAETAAEYADSLDITDPQRRAGAEQYVNEVESRVDEPSVAYATEETEGDILPFTGQPDIEAETFLARGEELTPGLRSRLESGERISAVLADQVSGGIPSFNIDGQRMASTTDFVMTQLAFRSPYQESVKFAFMDANDVVVHSGVLSLGSLTEASLDTRILAKEWNVAQQKGADLPRVVLMHNHPSGVTNPSRMDRSMAVKIEALAQQLGGEMVDFIVTDGETYFSNRFNADLPLPQPSKAPWELIRTSQRLRVGSPSRTAQLAATLRQGNPDAEFLFFTDNQNGLVGVEQIPPGFSTDQWAQQAITGAGATGAANVMLVTNQPTTRVRAMIGKILPSGFRVLDASSNEIPSFSENPNAAIGLTEPGQVAEEQAEFGFEDAEQAAAPFPVVEPPAPPPPAAASEQAVKKVTSDTGTAPPAAVKLTQEYPATEIAQWLVSDPSAESREAIDAEGIEILQNAPESDRSGIPTRVFGEKMTVLGRRGGPEERRRAIARASRVFQEAGLAVEFDAQNEVYRLADQTTPQEQQGEELLRILERELAQGSADGRPLLSTLINSVRNPDGGLWVSPAFSEGLRNQLFSLSQGEASFYGLMLGALGRAKRSLNFAARHVNVVLHKAYSDAFGGAKIGQFMGQIKKDGAQNAADALDQRATGPIRNVLNRLDTAVQQGVDLDYFMGQVLDLIGKGRRVRTPRPELQQLPSLFDLANWRLFITQRGGNQIAENIMRMLNGEPAIDLDGPQEGNVKRMDRLLQADLNRIVRDVIPQIARTRQQPNFLQDLLTASGDLQSRTERLDVVDTEVRRRLDEAEQQELAAEDSDPDEIAEKYELIREKWDEQFAQISGTIASDQMVRRILNQHLRPVFERLSTNWGDVVKGKFTVESIRDQVMREVEATLNEFNQRAPESAIDQDRVDQMLDLLRTGFEDMARKKMQDMRARSDAAKIRRKEQLPQRTAEGELNRLAEIHSDVQAWTVPEENAVREAIKAQRETPAPSEDFEATLVALGVNPNTARTLSRIVNRDIAVRRRHEQLRREQRVASPRPERGDQETQERKTGLRGLVDRIFAAPPQQQNDRRWQRRTALEYFQENGLTQAEAEDAWNLFEKDFNQLLRQAARRGLEQMRENLSRRERKIINQKTRGLQLWQRLEKAINAGVFDQSEILKEFAKEFGWEVPSEAQIETLKALSAREQQLADLTEDERERIGDDPAAISEARMEKAAATLNERLRIQNRMHSLFAQFSRPINFRTPEGRRNLGEAGREFISANMLLKLGFGVKQVIDVGTQFAFHMPLRSISQAYTRFQEAQQTGDPTQFWQDVSGAMADSMSTIGEFGRQSLVQFERAMRGEGVRRNVEGMRSTISGFDRMRTEVVRINGEIERLRERGDFASLDRATDLATKGAILRIMGVAEMALRFTRAMDNIQGVFVEQQEIRERLISELLLNEEAATPTEARIRANEILMDWRREQDLALTRAAAIAAENGLSASPNEVQSSAYEIFKSRQYARMKAAGLDANQIADHMETQRQTVGWNMPEETGIGGAVGVSVRALARQIERFGLPLPLGQFSNAIAIGINRGLTWTPIGFFPGAFGGVEETTGTGRNAWFRTPVDRQQRKFEAMLGTAMGGVFVGLMASGLIRVWIKPPDDPEEREIWQKEGHRAGTVEFSAGNGKFVPVSLTSGPMSLFRVPLTAVGAVQDMFQSAARRRDRITQDAESKGLPVGEIPDLTMADVGAAASLGAFTAITGGRTAGGALRSLRAGTERDLPTVKTSAAAQLSPFIVGLPAYQEMQRAFETRLDPTQASIIELMMPTQGSDKRRYNFLSDELGPGFIQQMTQTLTGGSFGVVDPAGLDDDTAYQIFRKITYRPSPIERNKGVFINGQIRPLTDEEYRKAQFQRGKLLKDMMSEVDPDQDPRVLTRWATKNAAVSKAMALEEIRAEAITLESTASREEMATLANEIYGELRNLPAAQAQAGFEEALAEGRIPLQNGDIDPAFLEEWRTLTRELRDPAAQ